MNADDILDLLSDEDKESVSPYWDEDFINEMCTTDAMTQHVDENWDAMQPIERGILMKIFLLRKPVGYWSIEDFLWLRSKFVHLED